MVSKVLDMHEYKQGEKGYVAEPIKKGDQVRANDEGWKIKVIWQVSRSDVFYASA